MRGWWVSLLLQMCKCMCRRGRSRASKPDKSQGLAAEQTQALTASAAAGKKPRMAPWHAAAVFQTFVDQPGYPAGTCAYSSAPAYLPHASVVMLAAEDVRLICPGAALSSQ